MSDARVDFGNITVFSNLNAVFPANALSVVVGPSGSGKSTLLSAMSGYSRLTAGRIRLGDRKEYLPDPRQVAWVPQGSNALAARSALANVMIGALSAGMTIADAEDRARVELGRVGLGDRILTPARLLSGGELQRVGFARALAASRPIIFADEPSASLDLAATRRLRGVLFDLRSSTTIIIATHDQELVAAAENIVDLRKPGGPYVA
ncbi:ATP-binding cassette domain-containing protein [Leifsonia soli]|uniref:ABC-type lipoprotein export system ATPase subunit n=1 Tax=Leifsonia soli TaxID=582665 RepID=A0A852T430_9MICO|nr:ABC-type lipoprotein export system ATPase subunit [Leifsonia soli]